MLKWLSLFFFLSICYSIHSQDHLREARLAAKEGNYDAAIQSIDNILDSDPSSILQCEAFLELARLKEIQGDLEASKIYIDQADSINQKTGNDSLQVRILLASGHYFLVFEQNEKAQTLIEEAVDISEKLADKKYLAYSFNQLSSVYHQLGDYQKALDYLEEAENYLKDNPADHDLIMIHKKRADNFYLLHEIEKSGLEYEKSYELASAYYAPTHDLILRLHNDLGAVYSDLGNYDKARSHLSKTVSQEGKIGANHSIADAYYFLSLLESYESNHELSIDHARKSLQLFEKVYGSPSYWVCAGRVNLADMYYRSGNLQEAAQNYHRAFMANDSTFKDQQLGENPSFSTALSKVYYIVAMMEKARMLLELYRSSSEESQLLTAYNSYQYLLEAIRQQRIFYGASTIQLDFGEDISEVYALAMETVYNLYTIRKDPVYLKEAIQIAEQGKSYYLALSAPSDLELQRWVSPEEAELLNSYRTKEITLQLDFEEQRKYDSKLQELREQFPEVYFQWFDLKETDPDQLRESLENDEMIIEYVMTGEGVFILAIDHEQLQFEYKPMESDSLVRKFRNAIEARSPDVLDLGHQLYEIALGGISIPENISKLKIIPDRDLHYIPFEALVIDEDESMYLIEKYTISYEHSIRLSQLHLDSEVLPLGFYGFAPSFQTYNKIPEALKEVSSVSEFTKGLAFTEQEASIENFLKVIDQAGILHFSTHAEVDQDDPSSSYMVLRSDTTEEDVKILSSFISTLDLKARMVTLSSCNTGVGKYKGGEGVMSLARNFALAGSPSIVMSLWPAADQSSSALMIDFYANLQKGMSKSEALRAAKLTHLEKSDNLSKMPYFWAHLVLIGDDSAVKFEPVNGPDYLNWLLIFLIPLIAFLAWKKLK